MGLYRAHRLNRWLKEKQTIGVLDQIKAALSLEKAGK
jgi:hypothetical protein